MKQDKRRRDIKSKLIAAVCMLLVSSIMMVSTTYAWFTLSTAPEVTGINTSVGANGALEMALLPTSGNNEDIKTGVGTSNSVQADTLANVTWGNLVNLEDASYGLSNVKLMPAALTLKTATTLNTGTEGTISSTDDIFLRTPTYGADGRVAELENTLTNGASSTGADTYSFLVPQAANGEIADTSVFGVRGIGTASAMTPRQQNYRSFRANGSSAMSGAQQTARGTLSANGQAIANMAVSYALGSDKFLQSDMDALEQIVLDGERAVNSIKTSITEYMKAAIVSGSSGLSDLEADVAVNLFGNYTDVFALMAASGGENADVLTKVQNAINGIEGYTTMKADYDRMASRINNAKDAIAAAEQSPAGTETDGTKYYTWTMMTGVLQYIANPDSMKVNGMTMEEIQADGGKDELVTNVINASFQVDVEVPTGSGIFADIADFAGNYQAPIQVSISYGPLNNVPVDAVMAAKTTKAAYLPTLSAAVNAMGAPEATTSGTTAITDLYGYVIDLAFRTNAASGTNLLLQGEGVDRIYADGGTEDTMGGGSNMTFTGATGFGEDNMVDLLENINVVFFDTNNGTIYGIAKPNVGYTSTTGEDGTVTRTDKQYTYTAASNEIKAELVLMNWTAATTNDGDLDPYGKLNFNGVKTDEDTGNATSAITTLNQNEIKNISVLVYMDGNTVENADVANAATSMTGTLNLQFATDTALTPMEYTPLMEQAASTPASGGEEG